MTQLSAPIPSPSPASQVARLSDGYLLRRALAAIWLMVLAHFLVNGAPLVHGSPKAWWAVMLVAVPFLFFISHHVRKGTLDIPEDPLVASQHWRCVQCGELKPLREIVTSNGAAICRDHVRATVVA